MSEEKFDVLVIGAGPGGYVAAIRASQCGAKVAVVEKGDLGGTCLNIGCIPTKTLIASAEILEKAQHAAEFGVKITGAVSADWPAMMKRKNGVVEKLRMGIKGLLKGAGIKVFEGEASFLDRKSVNVKLNSGKNAKVVAKRFIVATGSEPLVPGFIPKSKRVLTSTQLLEIKKIPKSLLVLGGGVIGCEFACLFASLGSEVTVVEMMPNILPTQDKEVARVLTNNMKKAGIKVVTGAPLENIKATGRGISGEVKGEKFSAEYLLVSIGRKANTETLNLEAAGVKSDERGWIPVNAKMRSNAANVYVIGDVTGTIWQLAHWASAGGIVAAENATGANKELRDEHTPGCIFTKPEIGSVGLTTEQCKEKGLEVNIGKFPFAGLGKAMAINETEGFCKIIADAATDQVLGVHIVGPHATDLIAEATTAMDLEITAAELGKTIHAHPTLGEVSMEAAHAVHGECIHAPARRKKK